MTGWYSVEWMVNESSGNESRSRKKKMMKSLKWVFKTLENWKKKLKEEIFALCLLNKSLKLKKEEKKATSHSAKVLFASSVS